MSIEHLVQEVEEVYRGLDVEISNFKQWSGLQCNVGCIKCCLKPDIEATALEFLPLALKFYREGKAYEILETLKQNEGSFCKMLDVEGGRCGMYAQRGMVCRLFGYTARVNKHGARELVTCSTIKTGQAEKFQSAATQVAAGITVPVMSNYYMQLRAIDGELGREFFPINKAIRKAIEMVLSYYAYREDAEAAAV